MKIKYVLEDPRVWKQLLLSQSQYGYGFAGMPHQRGAGLPGFSGYSRQRGAGLGSFFRGLFRMAMPVIKKAAKAVGKEALRTGVSVMADVARGGDLLPSLETHGRDAVATLADKTLAYLKRPADPQDQDGGGVAKRRRLTKPKRGTRKAKKQSKRKTKKRPGKRKTKRKSKAKQKQRRKVIKARAAKKVKQHLDIFNNGFD